MGASKIQYLNDFAKSQRDDLDSLQLDEDNERDEDGIDTFVLNTSDPTPGNNPNTSCEYLPIPSATRHEYWLIVVLTFWTFVLSVVGFAPLTQEEREGIVGLTVNMNLVVFYGAPLGTIVKVFESKNSVSIHWRTLLMGLLNSFFWLCYGIALMDMVIFVPNVCGFVLAIFQLILCICYPRDELNTSGLDNMGTQLVHSDDEQVEII